MGQHRLNELALLHIHDFSIDIDQIIEEFAFLHPHHIELTSDYFCISNYIDHEGMHLMYILMF